MRTEGVSAAIHKPVGEAGASTGKEMRERYSGMAEKAATVYWRVASHVCLLVAHLCSLSDHILSDCHHVVVVCICLVQLNRSEFWIVAGADAFIAENTPDLKHLLKAANNQALQMQLSTG